MNDQPERWDDVGRRIGQRIAELHLTKAEVIRRSGVSDKTITGYVEGQPIRRLDKRRDLCIALGWTPDSIDRILQGDEPEVALAGRSLAAGALSGTLDISDLSDEDRAQIEALVERLRRSDR